MCIKSYDSIDDSVIFSKERRDEARDERDAENTSEYYYDDSTGYRIYKPENEEEDLEAEREEGE